MTQKQEQNVPKLRFPGFEGAWERKATGEIGRVIRGASPRPKGDKRFYGGTVPRLMVEDVTRDGKYVTPKVDFLTEAGAKLSRPCKAGTLTIVCSGTVGIPSILAVDACIHDGFLALVDIEKGIDTDFFYASLLRLKDRFDASATHGGVFVNLTTSILKEFQTSFPILTEQQKIAGFLSAVDTKIAQLSEKKRLLEDYKKGCMQQLFSKNIRFKDEDGNDFPEWEEKKLGEVATFSKGKGISKADIAEDGENSCIRYGELYTEYNEHIERVVSKTDTPLKGAVISRKNDVLMPTSDVTPSGLATASALDIEGVILGGDILVIRSGQILNRYFAYFVAAHKPKIMRLVTGVTVYHIYGRDFATLQINIPHPAEQQKIAEFLSALDRKIILVTEELQQAETFKKGLLQQMFV
jgi:type I restriction enzyme S subunit